MSENYSLNHIRRIMHDLEVFHKWAENTIQQIPAVETSDPGEREALDQFQERFSQIATMYNNLFPIIKRVEMEWEKCVLERKKDQGKNNKN
ncbi:hypothetical protein ACFQZT_14895 [Paenibacillus sp. GCM10027628]|uniref:hypothetical protein n=1 Tax=Paenibacillus sp. GCM10027628 TaxID=3273413 RepID=UPI00363F8E66